MGRHSLPLVLEHLKGARAEQVRLLSAGDASALALKLELDVAIRLIETCERHGVADPARVLALPAQRTRTPSSEFRVVEDHESDDPMAWTEVTVGGQTIRPMPFSVILEPREWPEDEG